MFHKAHYFSSLQKHATNRKKTFLQDEASMPFKNLLQQMISTKVSEQINLTLNFCGSRHDIQKCKEKKKHGV